MRKPVIVQDVQLGSVGLIPGGDLEVNLFLLTIGRNLIPVSVEETKDGFKVDWPSFTQFYDRSLEEFFSDPNHGGGQFRVQLRRSHFFGTGIADIDSLLCLRVKSPIAPFEEAHVFIDKKSEAGKGMLKDFAWGNEYRPVVELKWITPPADGGSPRIELVKVVRPRWRG